MAPLASIRAFGVVSACREDLDACRVGRDACREDLGACRVGPDACREARDVRLVFLLFACRCFRSLPAMLWKAYT